ncbi:hypothetical protein M1432_02165 [Patescibacteria group bacterium]|nr:hypothetical protein [Patescibacteria group bacterium]
MKIEFNKITKLSRTVAIIILVGLPFWGFYVGYEYGLVQVPTPPLLNYTLSNLEPVMSYPTASGTIAYAPFEPKTYQTSFYSKGQGPLYTYSFSYPRDFDLTQNAGVYGGFLGDGMDSQVTVATPQDAFQAPKSNFGSAYFTVSVASGTKAAANCYDMPPGARGVPGATSTITVNGRDFVTAATTGVGAGNIYDSRVYRTVFDGFCFEAALTVHTGNIGMYTPGTVVPFDDGRAFNILEAVLSTFRISTSTAS